MNEETELTQEISEIIRLDQKRYDKGMGEE